MQTPYKLPSTVKCKSKFDQIALIVLTKHMWLLWHFSNSTIEVIFLLAGSSKVPQGSADAIRIHIFAPTQNELESNTHQMQMWVKPLAQILCLKVNNSVRHSFISTGSLINSPAGYGALLTLGSLHDRLSICLIVSVCSSHRNIYNWVK